MLFIHATKDYSAESVASIQKVSELLDVGFEKIEMSSLQDLKSLSGKFDFIFLATHACPSSFGESSGSPSFRWADFSLMLCETKLLHENGKLILGCCNGGLKHIALVIFQTCPQIVEVCGPRCETYVPEVSLGVHTFLYNSLFKGETAEVAASRASTAIGASFPIFNRYDLDADLAIIRNSLYGSGFYEGLSDFLTQLQLDKMKSDGTTEGEQLDQPDDLTASNHGLS